MSAHRKVYVVSKIYSVNILPEWNDDKESIPTIKDATLVNNDNAAEVAKPYLIITRSALKKNEIVRTGGYGRRRSFYYRGKYQEIRGYIERMEVNLAGFHSRNSR